MKKLNIFLLSITLLFASCSIISNPTEENNTKDNLALFTLNIGNSARTIYAAEYTEADLTDIKVTFTSKDTNKTVTALPTENAFSWRIPEGTYTVNVTANAKGYKLAGSASGVKVTKAEGGRATIRLSPSYEGFGNVEIKFLYKSGEDTFYNNGIPTTTGSSNGLEPVEKIEDNNLSTYLVELKSASTNQKYTLELTNNGNGITARNTEPIPAGFYTIKYADNSTAMKAILPDELIEVIDNNTTKITYYQLKDWVNDYETPSIQQPEVVTDIINLPIPTYHLAGNNSSVIVNNQTIAGYNFLMKGDDAVILNNKDSLQFVNKGVLSFAMGSNNVNITGYDFVKTDSNYNIYIINEDKTLYYVNDVTIQGTTITLTNNEIKGTNVIAVTTYNNRMYYIDTNNEIYCSDIEPNDSIAKITSTGDGLTVVDMKVYDNILYILTANKNDSNHFGGIYIFDLSQITAESEVVENNEVLGKYNSGLIPESDITNTFLGPCKILGLYDNSIYIADEGIYKDNQNQKKWRTRIMKLEHINSLTPSISERNLEEKYLLSNSMDNTDHHFETTWSESLSKFVELTN